MSRIERTSRAETDAVEIWAYIARDNEAAADELIDKIESRLISISSIILSVEAVTYIGPDVRRTSVSQWASDLVIGFTSDWEQITRSAPLHDPLHCIDFAGLCGSFVDGYAGRVPIKPAGVYAPFLHVSRDAFRLRIRAHDGTSALRDKQTAPEPSYELAATEVVFPKTATSETSSRGGVAEDIEKEKANMAYRKRHHGFRARGEQLEPRLPLAAVAFIPHDVSEQRVFQDFVVAADIDGDNDTDLVTASSRSIQ